MDSNNNFSQSILQATSTTSTSASASENGFLNISFVSWIFIILALAFLGLNIFVYFAKGTDIITQTFSPIINAMFGTTYIVSDNIVDVSAEGAKEVVKQTATVADDTLNAVQNATPPLKGDTFEKPKEDQIQNATINKSINTQYKQNQAEYETDYADSSIQGNKKSGWCYIGQDKNVRSCANVNETDTCMSGDIFPTNEICINPRLRS